jgi:hypothetical protein
MHLMIFKFPIMVSFPTLKITDSLKQCSFLDHLWIEPTKTFLLTADLVPADTSARHTNGKQLM